MPSALSVVDPSNVQSTNIKENDDCVMAILCKSSVRMRLKNRKRIQSSMVNNDWLTGAVQISMLSHSVFMTYPKL